MTIRFILFLIATSIFCSEYATASSKVYKTLNCRFEDLLDEFDLDADMTNEEDFAGSVDFTSGKFETIYPLTQRSPRQKERHRFVVAESDPQVNMHVQVFKAKQDDLYKAKATWIGIKDSPEKDIEGKCFYY